MVNRPVPSAFRVLLARIRTRLHRGRGFRIAAAAAAAIVALIVLTQAASSRGGESPAAGETVTATASQPLLTSPVMLPEGTRGVPIPVEADTFVVGDLVDVHDMRSGAAIVREAHIVAIRTTEAIVAVPTSRVGPLVVALTTDGVLLVLTPTS